MQSSSAELATQAAVPVLGGRGAQQQEVGGLLYPVPGCTRCGGHRLQPPCAPTSNLAPPICALTHMLHTEHDNSHNNLILALLHVSTFL